jgi:hypothetical protein
MPKTNGDLMCAMLDEMAENEEGRAALRRELLSALQQDPRWNDLISDEEFDRGLVEMRKSFPAFIAQMNSMKPARSPGTKS